MTGTITKVHAAYLGQQAGGAITVDGRRDRIPFLATELVHLDLHADRLVGLRVDFDVTEGQAYRIRRAREAFVTTRR